MTPSMNIDVSYPAEVAPGEVFDVTVRPGPMRTSQGDNTGRFTFDVGLPQNADVLEVGVSGATGLNGTPSAVRLNADKTRNDANGQVARIWGGASARYGPNSSTSNADNGLFAAGSGTDFRLPELSMTLRAPLTPGEEVSVNLPGWNNSNSGTNGNAAGTDFQYVRTSSGLFGNTNQQRQCSSGAAAESLTLTSVADVDPVVLDSSTALSADNSRVGPGQDPGNLVALVNPEYPVSLAGQDVTFRHTGSGEVVGTAPINASGRATLPLEPFTALAPGEPDVLHTYVAEYGGIDGDIRASESQVLTITNTAEPTVTNETTFVMTATLGDETDEGVEVDIVATINRAAGVPADAEAQLFRGDTPVGEPFVLPEGNTITFEDVVARELATRSHAYRIEFVTDHVEGYERWTGRTPAPVSVIVRGTDPNADPSPIGPGLPAGSLGSLGGLGGS
ncbi:hypothetical protein A6035_14335 [Dietzia lutea]|uniref:Bacterial Ig-like domain-containing protein n=1 Tax=Dietzia lutea TaxID=546160 RepID=A0A2S1RA37_9ACTN|nr:hypothetical protein A6035_14335 [Dietzia lutea]